MDAAPRKKAFGVWQSLLSPAADLHQRTAWWSVTEASMADDDAAAWQDVRNRLVIDQLIDGVVVEHRTFGMFVDIGNPPVLALAESASRDEARGTLPTVSLPGSRGIDMVSSSRGRCALIAVGDRVSALANAV